MNAPAWFDRLWCRVFGHYYDMYGWTGKPPHCVVCGKKPPASGSHD